jgi:hypothetical protein
VQVEHLTHTQVVQVQQVQESPSALEVVVQVI